MIPIEKSTISQTTPPEKTKRHPKTVAATYPVYLPLCYVTHVHVVVQRFVLYARSHSDFISHARKMRQASYGFRIEYTHTHTHAVWLTVSYFTAFNRGECLFVDVFQCVVSLRPGAFTCVIWCDASAPRPPAVRFHSGRGLTIMTQHAAHEWLCSGALKTVAHRSQLMHLIRRVLMCIAHLNWGFLHASAHMHACHFVSHRIQSDADAKDIFPLGCRSQIRTDCSTVKRSVATRLFSHSGVYDFHTCRQRATWKRYYNMLPPCRMSFVCAARVQTHKTPHRPNEQSEQRER